MYSPSYYSGYSPYVNWSSPSNYNVVSYYRPAGYYYSNGGTWPQPAPVRPHSMGMMNLQPRATNAPARMPMMPSPSLSPLSRLQAPKNLSSLGNDNILMQKPWRYMGVLNEYAEMLSGLIPKSVYKALWLAEMGYVAAESFLNTSKAKKELAATGQNTPEFATRKLLSRGVFHTLATILVPTLLISGINPFVKQERHGIMGGLKGITSSLLTKIKASPAVLKYGPAAVTFMALPTILKYFDPLSERLVNKLFFPNR